jgi:hypothetical protein
LLHGFFQDNVSLDERQIGCMVFTGWKEWFPIQDGRLLGVTARSSITPAAFPAIIAAPHVPNSLPSIVDIER